MKSAVIRELAPGDIDACCDIYLRNEPDHFPIGHFEDFKNALISRMVLWLVVVVDDEVIGIGGVNIEADDPRFCHLSFGMIRPDRRRQGFGSALLLARIAALPQPQKQLFVMMAPVVNSMHYYERFGFERFSRVRLPRSLEKTDIFTAVLEVSAWTACSSLLSASGIEFEHGDVPLLSGRETALRLAKA